MKSEDVTALYDRSYAASYDQRFLLADYTVRNTVEEFGILRDLLGPGARWLDVGCGTGFFLAKFPDVERAGLDLSPEMLKQARTKNPGALFREGDLRERYDDWNQGFTTVSCMWAAYAYVDTIADVERGILNLVEWIAPGGSLFLPVIDLANLRKTDIDYRLPTSFFSGETQINGCIWSWHDEESGKLHHRLIAPHVDQIIEWLSPWFGHIEIITYPEIGDMAVRRALLATERRSDADSGIAATLKTSGPKYEPKLDLSSVRIERLIAELGARLRPSYVWSGVRARLGWGS